MAAERQLDNDAEHDPPVAAAQRVRVLRGAVMGPEHGVHLATPAAKQGVVDDDLDRRALGQQPRHDQPCQGEPEPIGVPAMRREESAARVERHDRRHPGRREHPDTVRRAVCATSPLANSMNIAKVDPRRNAGRNASSRPRHVAGRVKPRSMAEPRISVELSSNRRCFVMLTAGSRRHADHATNTSHITRATQDKLRNSRLMLMAEYRTAPEGRRRRAHCHRTPDEARWAYRQGHREISRG